MRIIALINQKGGVGKTTSAINIGVGLSKSARDVLLIDLDPQAHLTDGLGIEVNEDMKTVYELLKGDAEIDEVLVDRGNEIVGSLKVIPSSIDLASADLEFAGVFGRETLLKEAMKKLKGFDFVLIDCPPSMGLLTVNALVAVKEVFVVLQTEYYSLQGTSKLMDTVDLVKKRFNKWLHVSGVMATCYDHRKKLHREVFTQIREYFGEKVFNTPIRNNVALAEAPGYGKSIFEYKHGSYGAHDYIALTEEILERRIP